MVIDLKEKLYYLATAWLTLSFIFFIVEYCTDWLQVVTLGGLVAGAFIEGMVMVAGLKLMKLIVSKDFYAISIKQVHTYYSDFIKALVVTAAFSLEGTITICRVLPGYTLEFSLVHGIFLLLIYPVIAIFIEKILMEKEQEKHGN